MISLIAVRLWQWWSEDANWPAWSVILLGPIVVLVILVSQDSLGIESFMRIWWWLFAIIILADFSLYAKVLRRSRFGPKNRDRYLRTQRIAPRGCGEGASRQ